MFIQLFSPLLDPDIVKFLFGGLVLTIEATIYSIMLSVAGGTVLAMCRLSIFIPVRILAIIYIETIRSLPTFLVVVFVYFSVYRLGYELPATMAVVCGLTVYHSAKVAEVVRAGIQSVARGEIEASRALGLNYMQTMICIVLPQAVRRMMPALTNQLIICLKDTTLGSIVGLNELLRRSSIVYQNYFNPVQTLMVVGVIYWIICFGLSIFSRYMVSTEFPRLRIRANRSRVISD